MPIAQVWGPQYSFIPTIPMMRVWRKSTRLADPCGPGRAAQRGVVGPPGTVLLDPVASPAPGFRLHNSVGRLIGAPSL